MNERCGNIRVKLLGCMLAAALLLCAPFPASAERTPRILLAGDSWTGFMLAFRSYRDVLDQREGLERWVEVGNRTAVMGVRAWEILENEDMDYFNVLANELTRFPNIDVVVMALGGNDILRGTKGVDPGNYDRQVRLSHCYDYPVDAWSSTEECIQWMGEALEIQIGQIVDYILSVRPDIRVAIVSYDYGAREPDEGYTIEEQHLAFIQVEMSKRNVALARDRVAYVNNFGLMQYLYGIPEAEPPIPPETVPYPCNAPDDPAYCLTDWPGGDPAHLSPLDAYIDNDIHLTDIGYRDIANRSLDFCIEEWLNYPKALEILPLDNKEPLYQFQVTFSHPVEGVDATDFEVFIQEKGLLKAMGIASVLPASGPADVYTVTVDMDGVQQAAYIIVQDDDSIYRPDTLAPLGGPNPGNGEFVYNGLYEFVDLTPPDDGDFDHAMQYLYMASQAYEYLLFGFSFDPQYFDANGNFFDHSFDDPIYIAGNALLDSCEFALIKACLDDPSIDLSANGGLVAQDVVDAWENNLGWIQYTMGGVDGLANIILPGLDTVLTGFVTVGDDDSKLLVAALISLVSTIEEFPFEFNIDGLDFGDGEENPGNYVRLPDWLSYYGDASGNGWNNEQIYAYFAPDGVASYVNAALNPNAVPRTGEGHYFEGRFVRIAVLDHAKSSSPWQWYRDGVPLVDDGRITGANRRNLDILSVQKSDEGAYTCDYIPKGFNTTVQTYGPINITVAEGDVPASGVTTLVLIAVAAGAAGIAAIRRKRP